MLTRSAEHASPFVRFVLGFKEEKKEEKEEGEEEEGGFGVSLSLKPGEEDRSEPEREKDMSQNCSGAGLPVRLCSFP